jgi:hypothetical protein
VSRSTEEAFSQSLGDRPDFLMPGGKRLCWRASRCFGRPTPRLFWLTNDTSLIYCTAKLDHNGYTLR